MVCQRIQLPDGGTAIVCGPRRSSSSSCPYDGEVAIDSPDGWRCRECKGLVEVYEAEGGYFIIVRHKMSRKAQR